MLIGQTKYSTGYSEFKFRSVKPGMRGEEVEKLLGQPLHKIQTKDRGEEIWNYTVPKVLDDEGKGANCHYTERDIWMINNVAVKIHHEFFFD